MTTEAPQSTLAPASVVPTNPSQSLEPSAAGKLFDRLYPTLIIIALLVAWEVVVRVFSIPSFLVPTPTAIIQTLFQGIGSGLILNHTWVTLQEILAGFVLAVISALTVAAAMDRWRPVERAIYPIIVGLQTIPKVALAPLLLSWFGFGITSKIVTTALLAFFPLLINLITGLNSTDKGRLDMFTALGASEWQKFKMLRLPHALPYFFAGLRIAITFSVIGAIVAEFVGAQAGLGYLIKASSTSMDVAMTFAVLVVLAVIGMILNALIEFIGTKVVFWEGKGLAAISGS